MGDDLFAEERLRSIEFTSELAQRLSRDDDLRRAIGGFDPLPFKAGEQAARWLQSCLETGHVPIETQLLFADDLAHLLGFYAVNPQGFHLRSEDDRALLKIRLLGARREMRIDPQPGTLIELIARSERAGAGFGDYLVNHAIASTIEKGSVAVLIEPDNEKTAALFRDRYRFMEFDEPAIVGAPQMLWYPVHEAVGGWPS